MPTSQPSPSNEWVVLSNTNLTPKCPEKSIFHLVLSKQSSQENLNYQPGDWLTLQANNRPEMVSTLLAELGLQGDERIELRRVGDVSVKQACRSHLELTQLNPAILNKLQRQHQLGEWADRQAMMDFAYGRDILDLLALFPQLKTWGVAFLELLAPLAPRYYSICSAPAAYASEVHLLIKEVRYCRDDSQRQRYGVVSHAVANLEVGDKVTGELKSNPTFKLPENPEIPIIMIGAGTGLAPFMGFLQQRGVQPNAGVSWLFFGETYRDKAFLFESELAQYQAHNDLKLFTAFSRDQAHKVYVQHRLAEQSDALWDLMRQGAELYVCGSQDGLAKGVEQFWLNLIQKKEQVDMDEARSTWQAWRKQKRLQLDVY